MTTNLHNRTIAVEMTDLMLSVILKGLAFEELGEGQRRQVDEIMDRSVELKDRIKKLEKDLEES